ncbi:MAG: sugar phosphate isomerase/epimerase family protein [Terriglobia bacterium]
MSHRIARRRFFRTAGTAAIAGAGLGMLRIGSAGESMPAGGEALPAAKMPRLFAGCCAYSYNKHLRHGPMTMEDFIRKAVELRVDGVDMTVYYLKSTDPAYLASLRHLAYKNAMLFSGAACGVSMVQADSSRRAASLNEIKKWIDATDTLGASHLRVFAGELPHGVPIEAAMGWVVDTMKAASDYSGKKGIMVGVEDHEGVTQNAEVCLELMHRVNSPFAGINLDITNFVPTATQDVYSQIEACIPYATHTHIRDHFPGGAPVDMDRVWRMFARAGFKGYMSAEYEGAEDPMTAVPKLVGRIRALCKKYSTV